MVEIGLHNLFSLWIKPNCHRISTDIYFFFDSLRSMRELLLIILQFSHNILKIEDILKKLILPNDYESRVYAGWLGKCIGVYFGGPIEGWSYEKIRQNLGEVTNYLQQPGAVFKPDDDLIMPLIMMSVLSEKNNPDEISAEEIGNTWRNLLSKERGGIWRGGYGISSEHTALINLLSGIKAPFSGSAKLNGTSVSEQIGGQIFSDIWGMVLPGNPFEAADLSAKAASVSHDGEGINGGRYIAALVSNAFRGISPIENVKSGLEVLPNNSIYALMIKDLLDFYNIHPEDWRKAREYVENEWGYDRFFGMVPIIPNGAVVVLSLLFGAGDFSKTIQIANMCGWDTDCNVGNVGSIMGVTVGLAGIPEYWRTPLNDFIVSSSIQGSKNICDLANTSIFLSNCGRKFAGETEKVKLPRYHFTLPGSTQGFSTEKDCCNLVRINQIQGDSSIGDGLLKISIDGLDHMGEARVFVRTHFMIKELRSNNYEASFTPQIFPGQTITTKVMLSTGKSELIRGSIYIRDREKNICYQEPGIELKLGQWQALTLKIPRIDDVCISEVGITFCTLAEELWSGTIFVNEFDWNGTPDYATKLGNLIPNGKTTLGWTTYSGYWRVEEGAYCGSGPDYNETYTCDPSISNYEMIVKLNPVTGNMHFINIRVLGGLKSYAFGFLNENCIGIMKKLNGVYKNLITKPYPWSTGQEYTFRVVANANRFTFSINDHEEFDFFDEDIPYLTGQVGLSNGQKCCTRFIEFRLKPCD